jgi:hypothetical protein
MEPEDILFIEWLEQVLLPDLRASGQVELVKDFQRMIVMARKYAGVAQA